MRQAMTIRLDDFRDRIQSALLARFDETGVMPLLDDFEVEVVQVTPCFVLELRMPMSDGSVEVFREAIPQLGAWAAGDLH